MQYYFHATLFIRIDTAQLSLLAEKMNSFKMFVEEGIIKIFPLKLASIALSSMSCCIMSLG